MTLPKAIIVELDGVLSDDSPRRHFIDPKAAGCIPGMEPADFDKPSRHFWLDKKNKHEWQPDWEAYHAAASHDLVNETINSIIKACFWLEDLISIVFITDRPEKYRNQCEKWLGLWKPYPEYGVSLFMGPDFLPFHYCRAAGQCKEFSEGNRCSYCAKLDNRPASIVKREIYEREIAGKYEVIFCIERDDDCCAMWRGLGLQVLRVC